MNYYFEKVQKMVLQNALILDDRLEEHDFQYLLS